MEKARALINKLDRIRLSLELSQDYMTTAMGVSRTWWYSVFRAGGDPGLSRFIKAANALGFEVVLWPTTEEADRALMAVNGSTEDRSPPTGGSA